MTNREHWITGRASMAVWHFAMRCRWDGQDAGGGWALIPHWWSWSRPRTYRMAMAGTGLLERLAWSALERHWTDE